MTQETTAVAVVDEFAPKTVTIGDFDPRKYNLLIRGKTVLQTNPFLRPVVHEILLDQPADTYPITQRKEGDTWVATEVGISAVGLANLASTAGIIDVPQASGRVDDGSNPDLVTYRATGAMRSPDGEWRVITRECTVKLAQLEKEIRAQKTKKGQENRNYRTRQPEPWSQERIDAEVAKELLLKEKFMERLAETGAKSRVTRALLGLAAKYSPAEIARPFVLATVVPDMSQPELRARMLDQATSAIGAVFGPVGGAQAPQPPRLLTAGPDEADVAGAPIEGGELTPDELGGAATTAEFAEEAPEGSSSSAAADEEPAWMRESTPAKAPEPKAKKPTLLEALRAQATEGDDADQLATETAPLRTIFEGIGWPLTSAGIHAIWDTEDGPQDATKLSKGQVRAIVLVHESMGHKAFEDAWIRLAEQQKARAAA